MQKIITVNFEKQTVSARELHKKIGSTERFSYWFSRQLQFGFVENEDYIGCKTFNTLANQELQDYEISIDMAKHICMVQRNERAKALRQYLIDLEKAWNTPEQVMARALKMADMTINKLTIQNTQLIEENKVLLPKAEYHDAVLNKEDLLTVTDIAKDLGVSARELNGLLVDNKILFKRCGTYYPYSNYEWLIVDGYADYKVYKRDNCRQLLKWTEKGRKWIIENIKEWSK